jgi:hypothetical protein
MKSPLPDLILLLLPIQRINPPLELRIRSEYLHPNVAQGRPQPPF